MSYDEQPSDRALRFLAARLKRDHPSLGPSVDAARHWAFHKLRAPWTRDDPDNAWLDAETWGRED